MARIRSVHPGLFTDEAFMQLTVSAPLAVPLLIGLWGEADDQGTFEWKPLTIKARILPAVPADVSPLLDALVEVGFIRRFEADGRAYGAIRNFRKWQRPEKPKVLHPLPDDLRSYVGLVADLSPKDRRPVADQSPNFSAEVGGRMEEVGEKKNPESEKAPSRTRTRGPDHGVTWPVSAEPPPWAALEAETRGLLASLVPEVWQSWRDHRMANGITPADPVADWRRWCAEEVKRRCAGTGPPARQQQATGETLAERARRIADATERRMAGGRT